MDSLCGYRSKHVLTRLRPRRVPPRPTICVANTASIRWASTLSQPRLSWEMRDARRGASRPPIRCSWPARPRSWPPTRATCGTAAKLRPTIDPGGLRRQAAAIADAVLLEGAAVGRRRQADRVQQAGPVDHGPAESRKTSRQVDRAGWPHDLSGQDGADTAVPLTFDGCAGFGRPSRASTPAKTRPQGTRFFRRALTIPAGQDNSPGEIPDYGRRRIRVVRQRAAGCSSAAIGESSQMVDIAGQLVAGQELPGHRGHEHVAGPAGLVGKLIVEFEQGEPIVAEDRYVVEERSPKNARTGRRPSSTIPSGSRRWRWPRWASRPGRIPAADEKAKYYACPLFRKEFEVKGEIRRATLYGSAWASTAFTSTASPWATITSRPTGPTTQAGLLQHLRRDRSGQSERRERHRRRARRGMVLGANLLGGPKHLRRSAAVVRPA